MRIFDIYDNEIFDPDLTLGYLKEDKLFIQHHPATEGVAEKWHYETIAEYANGGKDIKKVIDVQGVPAKNAWDEYEDIYRYIEEIIEEEATQSSAIDILSAKIKKLEQMMLMFNNWVESNINATVEEV